MDRLTFAAVADDDTGASDLAGMLVGEGLRTLLFIDLPEAGRFAEWSHGYDAVVLAVGTRNLSPEEARARTRAAIRIATARDPRVFQIKYCSTFDSTPEGNIGPSIDAAMEELGEDFTIALPALPVNGRTTYQGYHFVNGQLLSDSPMRHHPLTPMTNPCLVDLLGRQTVHEVGLARYEEVEAGPKRLEECFSRLRSEGFGIVIVDCLNDAHVETIGHAAADLRLVTGGSAFGMKLPAVWRERGWLLMQPCETAVPTHVDGNGGCLLVAGSCSAATQLQNAWLKAQGTPIINVEPPTLLEPGFDRAPLVNQVRAHLSAGRHCLLTTTGAPEDVQRVQEWGAGQGLNVPELGRQIASELADVVLEILQGQSVGGLIVAGGETSGAVCRRLELGALRVGRNIEPGVPLCFSLGRFRLPLALKSGNFGSVDFYGKALRAVARPAKYLV